jgi:hypothetical protein
VNPQIAANFQRKAQPAAPVLLPVFVAPAEVKPRPIAAPQIGCGSLILITSFIALIIYVFMYINEGLPQRSRPWDPSQLAHLLPAVGIGAVVAIVITLIRVLPPLLSGRKESDSSFEFDKKRYAAQMETYQRQFAQATENNAELKRQYQQRLAEWQNHPIRIDEMYYCQRDDVAFVPGNDQAVALSSING